MRLDHVCDDLAQDLCRDQCSGLFERVGVDGEEGDAVAGDREGFRVSHWLAPGLCRVPLTPRNLRERSARHCPSVFPIGMSKWRIVQRLSHMLPTRIMPVH